MKLQTHFTVPKKELKDLDYVKKVDFLEETINNVQNIQIKKIAWLVAIKNNQNIVVVKG